MSDWGSRPLGELLELVIDHRGKTPKKMGFDDFHVSGHPVLSAKHVKTDELVNVDSMRFANEEMYKKWMKVEVQEGDIVLTSEAPMGEVFYLDGKTKYVLGQRVFGLRANKNLINPLYLSAWLTSRKGQEQLVARSSGSTVLGIKQSELLKIVVDIPPKNVQDYIAKTRYDFSRKIELNRQINKTLEQVAQAIFKSWFVDFEPVKAKIQAKENGQDPERAAMRAISGKTDEELGRLSKKQYQQLAETAALFPDELEDSELGEIPKGWSVKSMKDISEKITKGTTPRKPDILNAKDPAVIPFIKVKDITDDGEIMRDGLESVPVSIHENALKRSMLRTDDLLFSIAGTIGRVSIVEADLNNSNTNQAVAFIRLKDIDNYLELCHQTLKSKRIQDEIVSKVVQGVQANASLANIGDIQIIIPDKTVLASWNKFIKPISMEKRNLSRQIRDLSQVRDSLLPKLLSGDTQSAAEAMAV